MTDGLDRIQPAPPAWHVRHRDHGEGRREPPPDHPEHEDDQPPDDDEPKLIDVRV